MSELRHAILPHVGVLLARGSALEMDADSKAEAVGFGNRRQDRRRNEASNMTDSPATPFTYSHRAPRRQAPPEPPTSWAHMPLTCPNSLDDQGR